MGPGESSSYFLNSWHHTTLLVVVVYEVSESERENRISQENCRILLPKFRKTWRNNCDPGLCGSMNLRRRWIFFSSWILRVWLKVTRRAVRVNHGGSGYGASISALESPYHRKRTLGLQTVKETWHFMFCFVRFQEPTQYPRRFSYSTSIGKSNVLKKSRRNTNKKEDS